MMLVKHLIDHLSNPDVPPDAVVAYPEYEQAGCGDPIPRGVHVVNVVPDSQTGRSPIVVLTSGETFHRCGPFFLERKER